MRQRFVFIFSSILLTFYLIAVGARGALFSWSAFLFVAGIGWILSRSSSRLIYALPYIAIVGTFLLQLVVPILIVFTEQGRTEFRYPQFAAAFKIFAMFPLTGGGTESYGYYNNFFLRAAAEAVKHGSSHNQLLQIAVGNGLLGILFYFGLLIGFSNEIRKRMIATDLASTPFILITAGMASAIVYGSVQEWNYLRPVMLMWTMLLYLPWHYQTENRSPEANRWWVLTPLCILALLFSYRSLPDSEFFRATDQAFTKQIEAPTGDNNSDVSSKAFTPTAPWLGVEYVDPDRFVIMQGESHILLPSELQIGKITSLREDTEVISVWSRAEKGRYLRIRCHSTSPDLRGDFDARRLCAEITIPESTKFFQSLERPALYRERTKQRGLF
ncbi:O-antigen ligase family protein [Leptonema illini]|uniref:O-antigen ligase family protein n=1 Tax=Leptonema illini TaxID=183 RepID=UPI00117B34EC|nr:O-antigen ligase family protein [Leptonema illini]